MAIKSPNVQIDTTITIFNVQLKAIFDKEENGTTIMVIQDQLTEGSSIKVSDMAQQLQTDIQALSSELKMDLPVFDFKWPEGVKTIAEALTITVNEVYLYIYIPAKTGKDDDPPAQENTIEYAFGISINNSGGLKFPIQIDSVGLKFWNASNKSVLDALKIINIDDYKPV